jgi:hypothetical protein
MNMDAEFESEVKRLARDVFNLLIQSHLNWCPFSNLKIEERVRTMENRFGILIGFMMGSGLLGGAAGALLSKLLGQ